MLKWEACAGGHLSRCGRARTCTSGYSVRLMTPRPSNQPSRIARSATYARSHHRSRSHESAHSDESVDPAHDASKIPHHPLIPRGQADLITTQPKLIELIEHLRGAGSFAYDSEFI